MLAVHPALAPFPMLLEPELASLAMDVKEHGLINPVVLQDEKILDGRARLIACERTKVKPSFTTYTGDPVSFVMRANAGRQMTQVQRAYTAAKLLTVSPETGGVSGETVAKDLGVSRAFVFRFKKLMSRAPEDVIADVLEGRVRFVDAFRASGSAEPSREPKAKKYWREPLADKLRDDLVSLVARLREGCADKAVRSLLTDDIANVVPDLYAIADGSAYTEDGP